MFKYPEDIDWDYQDCPDPPDWSCSHDCVESESNGNTIVFLVIALFFSATIFSLMQKTEKKQRHGKFSRQSEENKE